MKPELFVAIASASVGLAALLLSLFQARQKANETYVSQLEKRVAALERELDTLRTERDHLREENLWLVRQLSQYRDRP
jgi:cell division protein FtsB